MADATNDDCSLMTWTDEIKKKRNHSMGCKGYLLVTFSILPTTREDGHQEKETPFSGNL